MGGREGTQPVKHLLRSAAAADARHLLQHCCHCARVHVEQPVTRKKKKITHHSSRPGLIVDPPPPAEDILQHRTGPHEQAPSTMSSCHMKTTGADNCLTDFRWRWRPCQPGASIRMFLTVHNFRSHRLRGTASRELTICCPLLGMVEKFLTCSESFDSVQETRCTQETFQSTNVAKVGISLQVHLL